MRKIFATIFGNGNQASEVIDGAKKGLDAMFFTKEEKAKHGAEAFKLWIAFMEATKGQNVARRWIALVVIILWSLLVVLTTAAAVAVSVFDLQSSPHTAIIEVITSYRVTEIVLLIMAFYFGKHLLTSGLEARNK